MLKSLTLPSLLLLAIASAPAQTDPLTDFEITKRLIRVQASNIALTSPDKQAVIDYSFRPNTGQTFTALFQSPSFKNRRFTRQTANEWAGHQGFGSEMAMNTAWPDGLNYVFITQLASELVEKQSWGSFLGQGQYPISFPQLSAPSYDLAQNVDATLALPVNLLFSGFATAGLGFQAFIEVTIFDPFDYRLIDEETDIPANSVSFTIPANVMRPGNAYPARIRFVSPNRIQELGAGSFPPYPVFSQLVKETHFLIRTKTNTGGSPPSFPNQVTVTVENRYEQTAATTLIASSDNPQLTARYPDVSDITAVSFSQPLINQAFQLTREHEDDPFAFAQTNLDPESLLDGLLAVAVKFDNGNNATSFAPLALGPTDLSGTSVQNWKAAQQVQSPVDFALTFRGPSELNGFSTQLIIEDAEGNPVASLFGFAPPGSSEATLSIPADTLQPETTYQARTVTQPSSNPATSQLRLVSASETRFALTTAPTTWPGVSAINLVRSHYFDNESGESPPADPLTFTAELVEAQPGAITDASIQRDLNGQPITALSRHSDQRWSLVQGFPDASARDDAWPDGIYRIATTGPAGVQSGNLELSAAIEPFPQTRIDTTQLESGTLDPSLPVPIEWTGFEASGPNAAVVVAAFNPLSDELLYSGELIGIASDGRSGFIPGGALLANRDYRLQIGFRQIATRDTQSFDQVTLAAAEEHYTFVSASMGDDVFGDWLALHFTVEQRGDPTITGPLANPDNDAFINIIEFALNTLPLFFTEPPGVIERSSTWALQFNVRRDYELLRYTVHTSTTLDNPFTEFSGNFLIVGSTTNYDTLEVRMPKTPRLFFRLEIEFLAPLPSP